MNDRSTPNSVKQQTVTALLDAVERICAQQPPSTISMRAIAAEANSSLGLAYNYFESKDHLIGAALDRMAQHMSASATSTDDPHDALTTLLDTMNANPAFPRLVSWLVLEGRNVSDVMSGHPLMQQVAALARDRGAADPASSAMTMGLLAIGTYTYTELFNRAVGRELDDPRLLESVADMYANWFPGPTT